MSEQDGNRLSMNIPNLAHGVSESDLQVSERPSSSHTQDVANLPILEESPPRYISQPVSISQPTQAVTIPQPTQGITISQPTSMSPPTLTAIPNMSPTFDRSRRCSINYIPSPGPPRSRSPIRSKSPLRSSRGPSPIRSPSPVRQSPFNFKSAMMQHNNSSNSSLQAPAKTNFRRGHRYKHSSVSMNLFQEPPKRAPLSVPQELPVPTYQEIYKSLNVNQCVRVGWWSIHSLFAVFIYLVGMKSKDNVISTLAHLVFYDAMGNGIVVAVNVMKNFDFWQNPSLRYPFGLGRIEVLLAFALSVSLIFLGGDLFSHVLEEMVVALVMSDATLDEHSKEELASHGHSHDSHSPNLTASLLTILVTFVSYLLRCNGKFDIRGNSTQLSLNSPAVIVLLYASYTLVKNHANYPYSSESSTLFISFFLIVNGIRMVRALSGMLLLSFPCRTGEKRNILQNEVVQSLESLECFNKRYTLKEVMISKVNHNVCLVVIKIDMPGASEDEESKLRFYATKSVRYTLETHQGTAKVQGLDKLPEMTSDPINKDDVYEVTVDINRL